MPNRDFPLTALLLAAGTGARLGNRPKATLDFGGRTALDLVLEALVEGGIDRTLIVLGAHSAEVSAILPPAGDALQVVENPDWATGQLSSLQAGLRAAQAWGPCGGFLLSPVDYPLVDAPVIAALIAHWEAARAAGRQPSRVIPTFVGQHGHPVLFDAGLANALMDADPGSSARTVFQGATHPPEEVVVDCPFILTDIDTPSAYAQAVQLYQERLVLE